MLLREQGKLVFITMRDRSDPAVRVEGGHRRRRVRSRWRPRPR
jgi:hypothetical protein